MDRELDLDQGDERERPITKIRNLILTESLRNGMQAIRLCRAEEWGNVDGQVDGVWKPMMRIPLPAFGPLLSGFKDAGGSNAGASELQVRFSGVPRRLELKVLNQGAPDQVLTVTIPDGSAT